MPAQKRYTTSITVGGGFCGCWTIILILNLLIGGFCTDYVLFSVLGKNIPWWADCLIGLFLGEFTIPAAIVCWILGWFLSFPLVS